MSMSSMSSMSSVPNKKEFLYAFKDKIRRSGPQRKASGGRNPETEVPSCFYEVSRSVPYNSEDQNGYRKIINTYMEAAYAYIESKWGPAKDEHPHMATKLTAGTFGGAAAFAAAPEIRGKSLASELPPSEGGIKSLGLILGKELTEVGFDAREKIGKIIVRLDFDPSSDKYYHINIESPDGSIKEFIKLTELRALEERHHATRGVYKLLMGYEWTKHFLLPAEAHEETLRPVVLGSDAWSAFSRNLDIIKTAMPRDLLTIGPGQPELFQAFALGMLLSFLGEPSTSSEEVKGGLRIKKAAADALIVDEARGDMAVVLTMSVGEGERKITPGGGLFKVCSVLTEALGNGKIVSSSPSLTPGSS